MKAKDYIKELVSTGIAQTEIARKIGVTPGAITNYLYGKTEPTLETIKKIALAYDRPLSYFIEDVDAFNTEPAKNIVSRIKTEINRQGVDLAALVKKTELNQQRVNDLLYGTQKTIDVATMSGMCRALGIPTELIGAVCEPPSPAYQPLSEDEKAILEMIKGDPGLARQVRRFTQFEKQADTEDLKIDTTKAA